MLACYILERHLCRDFSGVEAAVDGKHLLMPPFIRPFVPFIP